MDVSRAEPEASDEAVTLRTFLIADIRGYTTFTRERGDEAAARLAQAFAGLARDAVEARSGTVIELRGDEALAVFPASAQAIRAALELQAACQEETAASPTLPLPVGIGIDAGDAVPVEGGFRGVALNMAARLCSKAAAGEVLLTRTAAGLAGEVSGIRFEERGAAELKGFEQPVELLQAVSLDGQRRAVSASQPAAAAAAEPALEPLPPELDPITPMVDREHEMHWLRGTWRQARRGRGRLVFVSGPAGIGKTRLIAELAGWIHASSGRVRYAGAGGAGTALALAAVREVAEATDPTLLVVNDLEALDDAVIEALGIAAASIAERPVMIVGAFRDARGHPALTSLVDIVDERGDGHRSLPPLDVTGVTDIVRLYAGREVHDAPVESMWRASSGVPSRVHELVGEWARDEAKRRLTAAAEWLAEGRSNQAGELEFANNVIALKLGRLYDVDAAGAVPISEVCPYKGLAAFDVDDAAYFFGRERLVGELAARTVGVGLLGVVGPSGSGKSSAVLAGLVPSLSASLLPGSERWQHVAMRPGEHPIQELRSAIGSAGFDTNGDGDLVAWMGDAEAGGRLILLVDQFEELFATTVDADERDAFVEALVRGATEDHEGAIVVLTIRADFYGHCAEYPELARLLAANHVLVGTMSADELRRAVELPARRVGLRVESALSHALVAEVTNEPGGLPLLSTTLVELWGEREGGWLRMDAYEKTGGLRGAVARLAERSYQQLTDAERQTAKTVLLRLVGSGEGEAAVRRRVPIAEFDPDRNTAAAGVLDRLTRDRLLTRSDGLVEIAHEALIREWPRLRDWLEEDVQGRAVRAHLTEAAKQWQEADRDPAELYRGPRLSVTMDWAATHADELNELEREFVSESRRASEREAERQRRTNRRLRGLLAGVAVFLVLALLSGGVALVQRGRARESAAKAERQADIARSRELASSAISVLDEDPELTILLAIEAKQVAPGEDLPPRLVSALHEAVRSMRTLMSRGWDRSLPLKQIDGVMSPDASLVAVTGRKETLQAWDSATGDLAWEIRDDVGAGWFSHPQFSPDGSVLAVAFNRYWTKQNRVEGGRATGIYLMEPRSGELLERIPPSSKCDWVGLPFRNAFTPDGAQLIRVADPSPCRDGKLRLEFVDLDSGQVTRRVPITSSPQVENEGPRPLLFVGVDIRHGRLHVSDGEGPFGLSAASTRMIDLASGEVLWKRPDVNGFLSPDGSVMALSAPDPTQRAVELVDSATGETLRFLTGQKAGTADVAFSDDGRLAYTAGLDGTARVWDTATGSSLITLTGQKQGLLGLSVDDEGDRLATFGRDRSVRIWDLTMKPLGETMALDLSPWQIGTRAIDAAGGVAAVMAFADQAAAFVFDPATGEIIRRFPDHAGQVLALTPDGRAIVYQHLVRQGRDPSNLDVGPIVVRDASTGATRTEFEGLCSYGYFDVDPSKDCPVLPPDSPYAEWVYGMSVTPDGRRVVAGGESFAASVWDLNTGSVVTTFRPFGEPGSGGVTSAAVHPDGSKVAVRVIADEPRVSIVGLDGSTLAEFAFEPPATSAGHLAFSPDGSLLAAGGSRLKAFDTRSWTPLWEVDAHDGGVFHLDFSPDSRSIVTTGPDGFVRLWDARDGSLLQAISMGEDYGKAVAFTDDRHVVVGTLNGLVAGLTFDVDELVEIGRSRVTRTLTDQECRTYLHLDTCP
jgi:WD40 repeat protein/class 3 adenylate cyclase/energy-coupling factor transporter ATP-binding protein EcfA2